ncbi:MAG: hypothetical protein JW981_00840 [Anaerolineae bacterium]|nr:hypothetical protein [Anaerolineae bacterium]
MRSPFITALLHPLNLLMLVAAAIAGLISAWWLFPAGLVIWLVMVVLVARDPSLRINHEMQSRTGLAQRFQRYFDRIERSQVGVFNSLASAAGRTRKVLQPIHTEIDNLTKQVYALCERMTKLENYRMVTQSQSDLQTDLQQINAMIESTGDPVVRREYEESRRSLEDRLAKLQTVSTQLDRVEAQLLSLANEMDSVVTEVIRLQAMGPEAAASEAPALVNQLRQQSQQLDIFLKDAFKVRI